MFLLISIILLSFLIQTSSATFPIHDPKEDKMINPTFDPRDKKACGMFKPPPTATGRVWNGDQSYPGQFPWAVCFIEPQGRYRVKMDLDGQEIEKKMSHESFLSRPDMNIWGVGMYEFSQVKGSVMLYRIQKWIQFCSGTIVDEHWILTAAHCFKSQWDGMNFYSNAGTTFCYEKTGFLRRIIVSRTGKYKTIFEHPNWLHHPMDFGVNKHGYDVALVRINDGYILPVDTYNNELINRACIYSFHDFPKSGCLKNVYFSGFGMKNDDYDQNIFDPKKNLTWFRSSRVTNYFCDQHATLDGKAEDLNVYCFSSFIEHGNLEGKPSVKKGSTDNETVAAITPNVCPGDSGGPFVYYMKYDKTEEGLQTGYRALLVSPLRGVSGKATSGLCESLYYEDFANYFSRFTDKMIYFKPLATASILWSKIASSFWRLAMNHTHVGQLEPVGSFIEFPNVE